MIATDPCIRLDQVADLFAAGLQAERGIQRTSVADDVNAFKRFESVVRQHGACSMDQVIEDHVEKYSQANEGYAPTTRRNRVLAVRRVLDAVCRRLRGEDKKQVVRVIALLDVNLEAHKDSVYVETRRLPSVTHDIHESSGIAKNACEIGPKCYS